MVLKVLCELHLSFCSKTVRTKKDGWLPFRLLSQALLLILTIFVLENLPFR